MAELRRKNPVDPDTGRRKSRLFQWLSEDVEDPKLRLHFIRVMTLIDASDDLETFSRLLDRALPRFSTLPLLALAEEQLPEGGRAGASGKKRDAVTTDRAGAFDGRSRRRAGKTRRAASL